MDILKETENMGGKQFKISYIVAPAAEGYHVGLTGDFDKNIGYLKELGYDGVEIAIKDIKSVSPKDIAETARKFQMEIPAVLGTGRGMSELGLSFSDKDLSIRTRAIEMQKEIIDFCAAAESRCVIGMSVGRYNKDSFEDDFHRLVDSIGYCTEYAQKQNSAMLIEPLDRFVPSMIQKIDDALRLVNEVGSEYLKLLLDICHMDIEEASVPDSIRKATCHVGHFHIADSNRRAPGKGSYDISSALRALKDISYDGFISAELTSDIDQFEAAVDTINYFSS